MATSAPLSPLRPSWDCICRLGRHAWCPQHGWERPQPTEPLFNVETEVQAEAMHDHGDNRPPLDEERPSKQELREDDR